MPTPIEFEDYFSGRTTAATDRILEGDRLLILRAGQVFQSAGISPRGYASEDNNALVTAITHNVWTPPNYTLGNEAFTDHFTFAANKFTYTGPNQAIVSAIRAAVSLEKDAGGGAVIAEVSVGINGTPTGSIMSTTIDDGVVTFMSTTIFYTLQTNDEIEILIRNTTDGDDIVVIDAQLIIG
jgi:hypothetical protein